MNGSKKGLLEETERDSWFRIVGSDQARTAFRDEIRGNQAGQRDSKHERLALTLKSIKLGNHEYWPSIGQTQRLDRGEYAWGLRVKKDLIRQMTTSRFSFSETNSSSVPDSERSKLSRIWDYRVENSMVHNLTRF